MNDNQELIIDKERVQNDFQHYRNVLSFLGSNLPIQALCLPKVIENALLADDCIRVCDLINRDLSKIKGMGKTRIDILRVSLDEFFTIGI